jgi:hypothetical protein
MSTLLLHPIILPKIKLAIVLMGFPILYLLNSFAPWSKGLFGQLDRSYRRAFFTSIQVLHWATAGAVIFWLLQNGYVAGDIGLDIHHAIIFFALFVTAGGLIAAKGEVTVAAQPRLATSSEQPKHKLILDLLRPKTRIERFEYVALCVSAGFCEEFLYRGFGILALKGSGYSDWLAVCLTSLSFAIMHGRAAFSPMGLYWAVKGAFYGAIFLWSDSLLLVMMLHAVWDLALLFKTDKASVATISTE